MSSSGGIMRKKVSEREERQNIPVSPILVFRQFNTSRFSLTPSPRHYLDINPRIRSFGSDQPPNRHQNRSLHQYFSIPTTISPRREKHKINLLLLRNHCSTVLRRPRHCRAAYIRNKMNSGDRSVPVTCSSPMPFSQT